MTQKLQENGELVDSPVAAQIRKLTLNECLVPTIQSSQIELLFEFLTTITHVSLKGNSVVNDRFAFRCSLLSRLLTFSLLVSYRRLWD